MGITVRGKQIIFFTILCFLLAFGWLWVLDSYSKAAEVTGLKKVTLRIEGMT